MKDFLKELREVCNISFATVSLDNKAKSRIFDIMDWEIIEDKNYLYFLTGKSKEVLKEIENNPSVAINVYANNISYRVEGEVEFTGDKEDLLEKNPRVAKLYSGKEDLLVPFRVVLTRAIKTDFNGDRPKMTPYRI